MIGVSYFLFTQITDIGIPCIIKLLTNKYCPGCGVSRMCISLVKGDFYAAFRYNALLTVLLPFGVVFGGRRALIYVKTGKSEPDTTEVVALIIAFALTILFWIIRNSETYSYLAPGIGLI